MIESMMLLCVLVATLCLTAMIVTVCGAIILFAVRWCAEIIREMRNADKSGRSA